MSSGEPFECPACHAPCGGWLSPYHWDIDKNLKGQTLIGMVYKCKRCDTRWHVTFAVTLNTTGGAETVKEVLDGE